MDEGLWRACYWLAAGALDGLLLVVGWLWLAMAWPWLAVAWPQLAAGGRGWLLSPRKGQQTARRRWSSGITEQGSHAKEGGRRSLPVVEEGSRSKVVLLPSSEAVSGFSSRC